ncbi:MAG TPA: regulatory protein RecX [Chryseolinea sp.]
MQNRAKVPADVVRKKIYHYCAYQERSHQEVKNKLYTLNLSTDEVDALITELIADGYLNEERFAKAFAGGKFRLKSWGKIKITNALEAKGLTKNCIRIGLKEIDDDDYRKTIESLLLKKAAHTDENNLFVLREKLATYAIQKGFEPELVWEIAKEIIR